VPRPFLRMRIAERSFTSGAISLGPAPLAIATAELGRDPN
jgi:hypothetical protein